MASLTTTTSEDASCTAGAALAPASQEASAIGAKKSDAVGTTEQPAAVPGLASVIAQQEEERSSALDQVRELERREENKNKEWQQRHETEEERQLREAIEASLREAGTTPSSELETTTGPCPADGLAVAAPPAAAASPSSADASWTKHAEVGRGGGSGLSEEEKRQILDALRESGEEDLAAAFLAAMWAENNPNKESKTPESSDAAAASAFAASTASPLSESEEENTWPLGRVGGIHQFGYVGRKGQLLMPPSLMQTWNGTHSAVQPIKMGPELFPEDANLRSSSLEGPPSLMQTWNGTHSEVVQPIQMGPELFPEDANLRSSSLEGMIGHGGGGVAPIAKRNSEGATPEVPSPTLSTSMNRIPYFRSDGPVRIPPREPPLPHLCFEHLVNVKPTDSAQPPTREDAISKFADLEAPAVLSPGSFIPNVPGVFQEGGCHPSTCSTFNLPHEDSFIRPSPHVVPPTAVPVEDDDMATRRSELHSGRWIYSGESMSIQPSPPFHSTSIDQGPSSGMQSAPSQKRDRISKCHVFAAATSVLVAIIVGLYFGIPIALKRQPLPTITDTPTHAPPEMTNARPTQVTEGTDTSTAAPVNSDVPTAAPTPTPVETNGPTTRPANSDRHEDIKSILLEGGISSTVELSDSSSPQYKASSWLANEDGAEINLDDHGRVIQRYTSAVLFFSMGGKEWRSKLNFLSSSHECQWNYDGFGIYMCDSDNQVTDLYLDSNNLAGPIPDEIGTLTGLTRLSLGFNHLAGPIPVAIGTLTRLTRLSLFANNLAGTIPDEIVTSLTGLISVDLSNNKILTGQIPDGIGSWTSLTLLALSSNKLTGTVPFSLTNLKSARAITLSYNDLTGSVNFLCDALPNIDLWVDRDEVECKCCTS